jgi:hypothetical protein
MRFAELMQIPGWSRERKKEKRSSGSDFDRCCGLQAYRTGHKGVTKYGAARSVRKGDGIAIDRVSTL